MTSSGPSKYMFGTAACYCTAAGGLPIHVGPSAYRTADISRRRFSLVSALAAMCLLLDRPNRLDTIATLATWIATCSQVGTYYVGTKNIFMSSFIVVGIRIAAWQCGRYLIFSSCGSGLEWTTTSS